MECKSARLEPHNLMFRDALQRHYTWFYTGALCMTLIKAVTIAACHSKLQSVMYDVPERLLQFVCHLGDAVIDAVHCKQTFLIVRQLQCVVACVCLQQEFATHIITPGCNNHMQIHHCEMPLCLLIQALVQAQ